MNAAPRSALGSAFLSDRRGASGPRSQHARRIGLASGLTPPRIQSSSPSGVLRWGA